MDENNFFLRLIALEIDLLQSNSGIPTAKDIQTELVQEALVAHSTESVLALIEPLAEHPPEPASYSQAAARKPLIDTSNKRTLVVKGTGPTPGKEIESLLVREKVAVPIKISKVEPRRIHVEITCNLESDMRKLQSELQANRNLNQRLHFLQKDLCRTK